MKKLFIIALSVSLFAYAADAQNIRRIGTWNMKWLGGLAFWQQLKV
jgi:hypothetical protein